MEVNAMLSGTEKTAAGAVEVIERGRSAVRGGTTMFFGTLADGRFVVASRFQVELRSANRAKAESVFRSLCGVD